MAQEMATEGNEAATAVAIRHFHEGITALNGAGVNWPEILDTFVRVMVTVEDIGRLAEHGQTLNHPDVVVLERALGRLPTPA